MYIKYFGAFSNPSCHSFTREIVVLLYIKASTHPLRKNRKKNPNPETPSPPKKVLPVVILYPEYCSFVNVQSFWVSVLQ